MFSLTTFNAAAQLENCQVAVGKFVTFFAACSSRPLLFEEIFQNETLIQRGLGPEQIFKTYRTTTMLDVRDMLSQNKYHKEDLVMCMMRLKQT